MDGTDGAAGGRPAAVTDQAAVTGRVFGIRWRRWPPSTTRERSSFSLLQRRAAAGRPGAAADPPYPAHYAIFEVLATGDASGLPAPLAERRALLENLLADAPANRVLYPLTTDPAVAREWILVDFAFEHDRYRHPDGRSAWCGSAW